MLRKLVRLLLSKESWRHVILLDSYFFKWINQILLDMRLYAICDIWLHIGKVIHRNSIMLMLAEMSLLQRQNRFYEIVEKGKTFFEHTDDSKIALEIARTLEETNRGDEATPYWQSAIREGDMDAHSLYVQSLLKRPEETASSLLNAQRNWGERFANTKEQELSISSEPKEKLRIGFTCSFFSSATIKNQLLCWLPEFHSLGHEVYLYKGDMTNEYEFLKPFADTVRHTPQRLVSDDEFVQMVRKDNLDILFELNGFSPGHRFGALNQRCAPVQVSYLNHAGTCGVKNVDYILADNICIPEGNERYYTEKIFRMPNCFFCFNFESEHFDYCEELPYNRNGFFSFGFFGSGSKLNNLFIDILVSIFNSIPESKFVMANRGLSCSKSREYLLNKFESKNISLDRIHLFPEMSRKNIATLHTEIDITFDSYPYCGGNTLAESLWYGVPSVSLAGDRFSSRYGSSLLKAASLSRLIAGDAAEYVEIVRKLTDAPDELQEIRRNLRRELLRENNLSNVASFAESFDHACRAMSRGSQG